MKLLSSRRALPGLCALLWALAGLSCSGGEVGAGGPAPAGSGSPAEGPVQHLEGRAGGPETPWGEASYKVKREKGALTRELQIQVLHAKPGVSHALTLDGVALGSLVVDMEGEGELELLGDRIPAGLEPKEGSRVRVGELLELTLTPLEKLLDLETPLAGPGALAGKIAFKMERLAGKVSREFEVKLSGAPAQTTQALWVGDARVADLAVDAKGKAKLEYSSEHGPQFPATFPAEIEAGVSIRIGEIYAGALGAKAGSTPPKE